MHHCSPFRYTSRAILLLLNVTLCVSQRVQLKRRQEVCKPGGAVTPRHHEGKFSGFDKHGTKTHKNESHLKDLQVSIISSDARIHLVRKKTSPEV